MLFENNPFSLVCSMVCNHEGQCEGRCIRGRKDTPVHFSAIETFISDLYLDRMAIERKPDNGHRVAVVGAGPLPAWSAPRPASSPRTRTA